MWMKSAFLANFFLFQCSSNSIAVILFQLNLMWSIPCVFDTKTAWTGKDNNNDNNKNNNNENPINLMYKTQKTLFKFYSLCYTEKWYFSVHFDIASPYLWMDECV